MSVFLSITIIILDKGIEKCLGSSKKGDIAYFPDEVQGFFEEENPWEMEKVVTCRMKGDRVKDPGDLSEWETKGTQECIEQGSEGNVIKVS